MGLFTSSEIDVAGVERDFGEVLVEGEQVLIAFRAIRDTVFLTTHRFVFVDVQGLTGSKVSVQSIPYRSITRFAVESAGTFDLDSDLSIWMSGASIPLTVKVSRAADPKRIQKLLAEQVLGARR